MNTLNEPNDLFKESFEVRDNEIDIQGIVSNTHYMTYLAHARHKYIKSLGVDFNEYTARGLHFVVLDCHLQFKHALKPNDLFYVTCQMRPTDSPIRIGFDQEIRLNNNTHLLILKATLTATCANQNPQPGEKKIAIPPEIQRILEPLKHHAL